MRRVLLLVRKDLLRRWRSPLGVVVMLAFPLLFSGLLALAFGGESSTPQTRLLLENRDDSLVGGAVTAFLGNDEISDLVELVEVGEEGREMMEKGEASALLILPEGATEALFEGETVTFELVRNPAQGILPEIAEQLSGILADVLGIVVRVLEQQAPPIEDLEDLAELDADSLGTLAVRFQKVGKVALRYVDEPPMTLEVVDLGEEMPPAGETADEDDEPSTLALIFLIILPGVSVYALFMIGDQMMRDVLSEQRFGTLRRQLTTPVSVAEVVASKVLLTIVVSGGALLVLAGVAWGVAGRLPDPFALVALALALVLAITGAGTTIYGIARTDQQGATLASLVYLALAFGSGSFMPVDNLPAVLQRLAPFSPFYWGTEGFRRLLDGAGLLDLGRPMLWLGLTGVVLLTLGSRLLDRRLRSGVAS